MQQTDQRPNRQSLNDDGKCNNSESERQYLFAIRELTPETQRQRKRQRAMQSSPNQHMLPAPRYSFGEEIAERNQPIDGYRPPDQHRDDSQENCGPGAKQFPDVHFQPDKQENQRIDDEGRVLPERPERKARSRAHALAGPQIADGYAADYCCDDSRQVKLVRREIRSVSEDRRDGNLDLWFVDFLGNFAGRIAQDETDCSAAHHRL